MKRFCFPKSMKLVAGRQFRAVLARRRRFDSDMLLLYTAPNDLDYPRLGVSAAKSCGSAVDRSRAKRLVREAFRQCRHEIASGTDYLVIVRPVKSAGRPRSWTTGEVVRAFMGLAAAAGKIPGRRSNRHREGDCG